MERMASMLTAVLAVVGATIGVVVGAMLGALISFVISDAPIRSRFGTSVLGLLIGTIGAPATGTWLELNQHVWVGVALMLGIFGMGIISEAVGLLKDGTVRQIIKAIIQMRSGGTK